MKIQQAETKIKEAGGNVELFWKWMTGQTVGIDENGETDVYDCDVDRFIRNNTPNKQTKTTGN